MYQLTFVDSRIQKIAYHQILTKAKTAVHNLKTGLSFQLLCHAAGV